MTIVNSNNKSSTEIRLTIFFMKQISIWAYHHKWLSRVAIILSHLILIVLALFIADILPQKNILVRGQYIFLSIAVIAFAYYPAKKDKQRFKKFYRSQKTADLILVITGFLLTICFSSKLVNESSFSVIEPVYSNAVVVPNNSPSIKVNSDENNHLCKERKTFRHQLNKIRRAYKEMSPAGKTVLIILSVLVAMGLSSLVAAAACSLSCSGSEVLAAIVGVVGMGAIIFGLIKVIQAILGKKKKKQAIAPPKSDSA